MNLIDLEGGSEQGERHYDICIVGAGAAGSYLASRLADAGMIVALVEAGNTRGSTFKPDWFEVNQTASEYSGATDGRYFGLGGSTSRWGGCLVPHTNHDLRANSEDASTWDHIVATVAANSPAVLKHLEWPRVPTASLWAPPEAIASALCRRHDVALVQSLFLPFRKKRLSWLLGKTKASAQLDVHINAVATNWVTADSAGKGLRIVGADIRSRGGKASRILFNRIIFTAGTLETTRCLLELAESLPKGAIGGNISLGRGLSDHLSMSIADIVPEARRRGAELFAPWFEHGWMRNTRLIALDHPLRSFLHVIFENESVAFRVAKEVFLGIQAGRFPKVPLRDLMAAGKGGMQMAWQRYARNRLHVPHGTPAHLQMDMEQTADPRNRLTLDPSKKDALGRSRLTITWGVREADERSLRELATRYLDVWQSAQGMPRLQPREILKPGSKPHDAYHPVGTCRMGTDADAVVDLNLAIRGVQAAWVASTAVLPSAGTANPTFTLLCQCERLAVHLTTGKPY